MSSRGQVPILKDGDTIVSESLAALQYLEQAYPEPCLVPKIPLDSSGQSKHAPTSALLQLTCVICFLVAADTHGHPHRHSIHHWVIEPEHQPGFTHGSCAVSRLEPPFFAVHNQTVQGLDAETTDT